MPDLPVGLGTAECDQAFGDVVPVASKRLASKLGKLKRLEDAPWISWGPALAHIPPARWLRQFGPGIEPVLVTSSYPAQRAAALAGVGLALLTVQEAALGGLAVVPLARGLAEAQAALPRDDLFLVGHRALRHVPRVAAVWEFLVAELGYRIR